MCLICSGVVDTRALVWLTLVRSAGQPGVVDTRALGGPAWPSIIWPQGGRIRQSLRVSNSDKVWLASLHQHAQQSFNGFSLSLMCVGYTRD